MSKCVFLAGAAGAIGRPLASLLVAEGWRVVGTTRSPDKAAMLSALGVEPAILDVFDAAALADAVGRTRPWVVIHQLTDLPLGLDPGRMVDALVRNARLRDEGTRNLVAAALQAGVRRLIAQSVAFTYADGPLSRGRSAQYRCRRRPRHLSPRRRQFGATSTRSALGRRDPALWPALWPRHRLRQGIRTGAGACRRRRAGRSSGRSARCPRHLQHCGRGWRGIERQGQAPARLDALSVHGEKDAASARHAPGEAIC